MGDETEDAKLDRLMAMAQDLHAMASAADSDSIRDVRARMAAISGGYDFADTLHNVYLDYGYPAAVTFSQMWNMYRRFGIARNAVELHVITGWSTPPEILGNNQFNRELEILKKRLKLMIRLKALDTRQRVGRYAGLFMRVADGNRPEIPLEGRLPGQNALQGVTPLYESQLEVIESDTDPNSPNFGQPVMLQYRQSVEGDRNEETNNTVRIHASRVVFAAEDADDGSIYGVPVLEPIFNSLMDLRKIIGAGGEGFYRNAAQRTIFELKDGASANSFKDKLNKFNEEFDSFTRDAFRRSIWAPGMEAKTLQSTLIQPEQFFNVALNDVAAGTGIPATILIGKQTGRLASLEDSKQFLATVQSRRENFQSDMTRAVIDWMIQFGVLPATDYEIEWDDLLARSDVEKLESGKSMAQINKDQFLSGGGVPFTGDEIREASGFEAEEDIDPGTEELPDGDEDE